MDKADREKHTQTAQTNIHRQFGHRQAHLDSTSKQTQAAVTDSTIKQTQKSRHNQPGRDKRTGRHLSKRKQIWTKMLAVKYSNGYKQAGTERLKDIQLSLRLTNMCQASRKATRQAKRWQARNLMTRRQVNIQKGRQTRKRTDRQACRNRHVSTNGS